MRPEVMHRLHIGLASSHLTRRMLAVKTSSVNKFTRTAAPWPACADARLRGKGGWTYRQVIQPVRVLVAHRFCRGGLVPSFSVGGDAMTATDPDTDEVDDDDEDGSRPLSRPRAAGASGVCPSSTALAGAMVRESLREDKSPENTGLLSAAVAQLCGRKKPLDELNSGAMQAIPRGGRK
ncbi:hypothetical protein ARSEF4850_003667 [Beauveria asiatica]